ncbi:MAG: methyltransferase domain-containing protein [Methylacidiphilales bacterium]|nr:methyltransferase domain-containing protein [Candidatus Methylacidiphilales bacterium]
MHIDFYRKNKRYSETLRDSDPRRFQALPQLCSTRSFYEKYERALRDVKSTDAVILDVGCGVGQVVRTLVEAGYKAHGVEVSETNLALAREQPGEFHLYNGLTLPFADQTIDSVGAFNVVEHVEDPVTLLDEMTRVLRPSGRIVVSSPNFLRVIGWRDYHPSMRGVLQKWNNVKILFRHVKAYANDSTAVIFEKMTPIQREPFQPDDDAIIATNAIDFSHYLKTRKYKNIHVSCVDRPVPKWIETVLDLTPLRFVMLNSFVTAEKSG